MINTYAISLTELEEKVKGKIEMDADEIIIHTDLIREEVTIMLVILLQQRIRK